MGPLWKGADREPITCQTVRGCLSAKLNLKYSLTILSIEGIHAKYKAGEHTNLFKDLVDTIPPDSFLIEDTKKAMQLAVFYSTWTWPCRNTATVDASGATAIITAAATAATTTPTTITTTTIVCRRCLLLSSHSRWLCLCCWPACASVRLRSGPLARCHRLTRQLR